MTALASVLLAAVAAGGGDTVLLDFYSDYCPPCRMMAPVVEQLAAQGYPVRKVNVTREQDLAARFGIHAIPCFVMLVDGREAARATGAQSMERLEQMLALGRSQRPSSRSQVPVRFVSAEGQRPTSTVAPAFDGGREAVEVQPSPPGGSPGTDRRENGALPDSAPDESRRGTRRRAQRCLAKRPGGGNRSHPG